MSPLPSRSLRAGLVLAVLWLAPGCSRKDEQFESVAQIVKRTVVEGDEKGAALVDLELEWDPCPGDQFQMVRGGKEFAACTAKYEDGDFVPVRVVRQWDTRGRYTWDVFQIGDCARRLEVNNEGSYEKSQECRDETSYGQVTGFACSRRPFRSLVSVCPFMARN